VLSHGERIVRGYGVRPETTFRIASITKPLVAALALRLVEEGRLSLEEMQTAQIGLDPGGDYGLGLFLWRGRTRPTIEHAGSVPGFRSHLVLVPEEATAFVLLAGGGERGRLLTEELLDAVGLGMELPPETRLPEQQLARFAAPYLDPLGTSIVVSVREGGLDFAAEEGDGERHPAVHLRPAGPEWFVVLEGDDRGETADFPRDGRLLRYGWLFERVES